MNPRALLTFGRRVADTQETGDIVDVGADALREAFMADVAIVVLLGRRFQTRGQLLGTVP